MHALNEERDAYIQSKVEYLRSIGFQIEYDVDANSLLIENMEHINELVAKDKGTYDTQQEADNAYRKEVEKLTDELEELNDANQDNSDSWWDLQDSIREARVEIVNSLQEIVSEASEAVDVIQNVSDVLHQAAQEYAANGGFISVDTFQEIINLGPEYMKYLRDENGLLVINEETINKVTEAKVRQLAAEQALTYVERLRLAVTGESEESLEDLLGITVDTSDATFGLAKAELALMYQMGDMSEASYQTALHNLLAIEDLMNVTISGIGQTAGKYTDELEEMQEGVDDVLQYVMDMIKQQVEDEIDGIEDIKDSFAEYVDLRKKALEAAKDEADYQDKIADKTKEIAKLQEKINALSLDDSRDAQAQKASLMEEMEDLQKELADEQSDYLLDAQGDALDDMQDSFENEMDAQIKTLEDSISSQQKIYDKAVDYISKNWDTLHDELKNYIYEYGNVLVSEMETSWDKAIAAAQKYGDFVSAMKTLPTDIATANSTSSTIAIDTSDTGADNINKAVATTDSDNTSTREEMLHSIIKRMYANSLAWHNATSKAAQKALSDDSARLGEMLPQYGVNAYRSDDGTWYVGNEKLFDKYSDYIYHQGGIVGNEPTTKQNEVMAVLEKGEAVLDKKKESALYRLVEFATTLSEKFSKLLDNTGLSSITGGTSTLTNGGVDIPSNVSNNKEINIAFGDTYITGTNEETVEKHQAITRKQANELLEQLNIKR
jgi:hypothetical protein